MDIELRDYVITPGHLDRPQDRFVWVLAYDGQDGFDAADERYHSLAERRDLDPEPSSFVKTAQIARVAPVVLPMGRLTD